MTHQRNKIIFCIKSSILCVSPSHNEEPACQVLGDPTQSRMTQFLRDQAVNRSYTQPKNLKMKSSPSRYQRLDLFIKVLSLLCPNLTDDSSFLFPFPKYKKERKERIWKVMWTPDTREPILIESRSGRFQPMLVHDDSRFVPWWSIVNHSWL